MSVRVRFAPSPTGFLHLGGLRTALFNYAFARQNGGKFILRIEDTDDKRTVEGAADDLQRKLEWAGLQIDEGPQAGGAYGPYIQSQRLALYKEHCDNLLQGEHAYRCFCTPARLEGVRQKQLRQQGGKTLYDRCCLHLTKQQIDDNIAHGVPFTVRLRMPEGSTEVSDIVFGEQKWSNALINDTILLKANGTPTYHLASVVDDHHMEISHVIRGEEWTASVPTHVALYNAFEWEKPEFAHLPLLLNSKRAKLSKRHDHASVAYYQERGFLAEGLVSFVSCLGWTPPHGTAHGAGNSSDDKAGTDLVEMDDLIRDFHLASVKRSPAIADAAKARYCNGQVISRYLQGSSEEQDRVVAGAMPFLQSPSGEPVDPDKDYLKRVMDLTVERLETFEDLREYAFMFGGPSYASVDAVAARRRIKWNGEELRRVLTTMADRLHSLEVFAASDIKGLLDASAQDLNLDKPFPLYFALRYALTGAAKGPPVWELTEALGRGRVDERLRDTKID